MAGVAALVAHLAFLAVAVATVLNIEPSEMDKGAESRELVTAVADLPTA